MRYVVLPALALLWAGCNDEAQRPIPKAPPAPDVGSIRSEPLAERASAPDGPLFESLGPERTGVDFVLKWEGLSRYERAVESYAAGAGLAVGDTDGDGRPDLFLCRPHGGCRLYRNLGDFRFEDVTRAAGLEEECWAIGASFVDIDNDGDLDLYVCAFEAPNRLYINRGDGTFEERAGAMGLAFAGRSTQMAFADVDGDGRLDGYLLTNQRLMADFDTGYKKFVEETPARPRVRPGSEEEVMLIERAPREWVARRAGQRDRLFLNGGAAGFRDVSARAGLEGALIGLGVVWWDYNEDGRPDLYVANDLIGPDQLWRNNGDGTFTNVIAEAVGHTPLFSMGVDIGDINNDGRVDLVATDMAFTSHYKSKVMMGNMNGPNAWVLTWGEPRQAMQNAVYLNTGTGRFMEAAVLLGVAATDWTWAPRLLDLDEDGRLDLFFTNGMTRDYNNSDLQARELEFLSARPDPDAAYLEFWRRQPIRADADLAFRNLGDLKFENVSRAWGLDQPSASFGAAAADLDGDGDLDLVVNRLDEPVGIFRNRGAGHRVKVRLEGRRSNRWGIGATVRIQTADGPQVRYLTLARGYASADEPIVHFGLGACERIERLSVEWPGGASQSFENLEADRFYTIVEPTGVAPAVAAARPAPLFERADGWRGPRHRELPFDDYALQPLLPWKLSQLGPGVAVADVDGDGREDLFVGGGAGQEGVLCLNRADGWKRVTPPQIGWGRDYEDLGVLFFDADGDGATDLYVARGSYEHKDQDALQADGLYLGDGRGGFRAAPEGTLPALRDWGSGVSAADYDRDGDLDLFVGSRGVPGQWPLSPDSRLLRNDGGKFVDVTDEAAPGLRRCGMVTSSVWTDVDGDGWPDLLVTTEYGPIRLWKNRAGRLEEATAAAGLARWPGLWNGIAAADLNNDGHIDFVATNMGLNTKYHATPERPIRVYYGDFDGSGTRQIVEASFEGETLFPIRGKSCSTAAMPMLARRFTTFDAFARATLAEIYEPKCLTEALKLEATELSGGAFLNDGTGRFEFVPFPRAAQVSIGFGIAAADVDADGNVDVYLVQNFFHPQPETPRMDGGVSLLLRGRGDGTFEPVWPDRSGLGVAGDAKGLAAADLNGDGRVDFVVTQNDGDLLVFENRTTSNRTLTVRLRGKPGNPTGVGARVTLILADGSRRTAEVSAGGSYLSQSSAALIFGLGASGAVDRVEVRWPDGSTSSAKTAGDRVVVEQP
jgi:hypothetical protein